MKQTNTWKHANETKNKYIQCKQNKQVKKSFKQANKKEQANNKEKSKQRNAYIDTKRGKPKCLPVQSFSINRKGFWLKD